MLPFTREQFFSVLVTYNNAIWPTQILAYLLGGAAVWLLFRPSRSTNRLIAAILAVMWLWTGIGYHWLSFVTINPAAYAFALLFVLQGAWLIYAGVIEDRLVFGFRRDVSGLIGIAFVVYAAIVYPLFAMAIGHGYPELPMFGVTPCPVTIFTFGLLLLTTRPVSWVTLALPFIWSLIGGSAAFLLGVAPDWVLLASGLIALPMLLLRDRNAARPAHT